MKLWQKILIAVAIVTAVIIGVAPIWKIAFGGPSLSDRITVMNYRPTEGIVDIVEGSGMNNNGRFYFYIGQPQLDNREAFNHNCADVIREEMMVLGCYDGRIYLFDVTDDRIDEVKSVTAVHEMLHAAYERLGAIEKSMINKLLNRELEATTDEGILEMVDLYEITEPGQRYNELHSIFATEVGSLSPELEDYYLRYFDDRQRIVTEHEKYKKVFTEMEQQAEKMESELENLSTEIENRRMNYEFRANQLSSDIDWFNSCADTSGCFVSEYSFNIQRNSLLAEQNALDIEADDINALIERHNKIVTDLQALGREAEDLQNSINSQSLID